MKRNILSLVVGSALVMSAGTYAADNNWERESRDAWIDGKAEATLLFNGNLDSFDINTDVENGTVTLTGKVESDVDKKLAEELIRGIDGVKDVSNKLTVHNEAGTKEYSDAETSGFVDAKIATVVKSRFLFDTDISGTSIDVDVKNGVVTLTGDVESEAEKQLAVNIAKNANDVREVNDKLTVTGQS